MLVRPKQLTQEGAALGQVLVWNGTLWVPGSLADYGLKGDLGSMYVSTPTGKAIVAGTPAIIGGNTTAIKTKNFTHTNQRLTYNGAVDKTFQATAAISAQSTVGNIILSMFFAKNGAIVPESEITRKIGTANDVGAAALVCTADCSQNDYVEVWIDVSANATITIDQMVLAVTEV